MSVNPRSQSLLAFKSGSGALQDSFTCPGGMITLVKSAAFYNSDTASHTLDIELRTSAAAVIVTLYTGSLAAGATAAWDGWHVLNPGDLVVVTLGGASMSAWVSGAVLLGTPTVTRPA